MFFVIKIYGACFIISLEEIYLGSIDFVNLTLLFSTAVASIAQFLLIWGAGGLGIIYASLHLNVAPFYVYGNFRCLYGRTMGLASGFWYGFGGHGCAGWTIAQLEGWDKGKIGH